MANPGLRQIWVDIRRSPALMITLVVIVIGVLYYVYKQNQPTTTTSGTNTGNVPTYEIDTISVTPPASSAGTPQPPTSSNAPGTTFTGPTGVKHYVTTGNESLTQIAQKLGLSSWNSIYAIPENHKNGWVPNGLTANKAATYVPPANIPIVY